MLRCKGIQVLLLSITIGILANSKAAGTGEAPDSMPKRGLKAEYYKSEAGKYFAQLGTINVDNSLDFQDLCPKLAQNTGGTSDHTAVRWTGKIEFPRSEEYTFYMIGDNGFRLWIDGYLAIDHWVEDWDKEQKSAPLGFAAGSKHDIKVEFFNVGGGANLKLSWSSASQPKQIIPASSYYLPDPLFVNSDLQFYIDKANRVSKSASVGSSVGCYPQTSVDHLRNSILHAQTLHDEGKASSPMIETELSALQKAQDGLLSSVVKEPFDAKGTGNPVVPGYWADPTFFYDKTSDAFYCFATVDGTDAGWQHDPHLARSKDMVSWDLIPISLPSTWPLPVPGKPCALWAPSIVKNPSNGKYYLTYFIEGRTYIAFADSPLGPWTNATKAPGKHELNDSLDTQLFVDTDGKIYVSHGACEFKLSALKFDADNTVSIDDANPNMTEGRAFKYKTIQKINVYGEGSALYKKNGTYYLFYAEFGSQNYAVKCASASSIWGPYTEQAGFVMERDAARDILGPGHVSIFDYGDDTYIAYHRQHFPFVDSKRQTCVNRLTFKGNLVSLDVQTQSGMRSGDGALEKLVKNALSHRETNLALGKVCITSSVSDFKGGEFNGEVFKPIEKFYDAHFAVDDNWGTRWMAGVDQTTPSYLIVDLGADTAIGRTETIFEHVRKLYKYKIDYLQQSDAANIDAAKNSTAWKLYADRSNNSKKQSPLVDSKAATARYLKITILSADLPGPEQSNNPGRTDYLNRVSIVEFGVFAKTAN